MASTKDIAEWARNAGYGATVVVPEGLYAIETAIVEEGRTIDARRATFFVADPAVEGRTISLLDSVHWIGGDFVSTNIDLGAAYLEKVKAVPAGQEIDDAKHCPAVFLVNGDDNVWIERARFAGVERAVAAIKSQNLRLEKLRCQGFFSAPAKVTKDWKLDPLIKDFTRTTYAIYVQGGDRGQIKDVDVNNAGGAVVLGSAGAGLPDGWLIDRITGDHFGDNGIYLSSGRNCTIQNCDLEDSGGSMIKVRGYGHVVSRNILKNGLDGIGVEGIGKTADPYGANGAGCIVEKNVIDGMRTCGIWTAENGEFFPRDVQIVGNYLKGAPDGINPFGNMTKCALSLRGGEGFVIDRNTIEDCKGEVWLHLAQAIKTELKSYSIGRNTIRGGSREVAIGTQRMPFVSGAGVFLNA